MILGNLLGKFFKVIKSLINWTVTINKLFNFRHGLWNLHLIFGVQKQKLFFIVEMYVSDFLKKRLNSEGSLAILALKILSNLFINL